MAVWGKVEGKVGGGCLCHSQGANEAWGQYAAACGRVSIAAVWRQY